MKDLDKKVLLRKKTNGGQKEASIVNPGDRKGPKKGNGIIKGGVDLTSVRNWG